MSRTRPAVLVLGTGGTIASRTSGGVAAPVDSVDRLVRGLVPDLDVEAHDLFVKDSSALTPADQVAVARAVLDADDRFAGVVVTHGTDTMEETAYLLDLVHAGDRPVVVTGAQRPADAPDADGPRNLADAVRVAADPAARGLGVLVVFDGRVHAARGTRKVHTVAAAAFAQHDGRALGRVVDGRLFVEGTPAHREHLPRAALGLERVRVDIAATYPGADDVALRAFAAAGARGVVLQATGAGNASPGIVAAVADLTRRGVVVALTTRVDQGAVAGVYGGGGGGADLVAAGAVPLGTLRAGQGRVLVLALLAALDDAAAVRAAIPAYVDPAR
ncbi:asparaginase [Nocardioides sp. TF02-7]|uniref:asparaginase n=1 Tax=Nocardioides sp. TF02-7 TaxID=2917724 RepID=UPI001F054590|nr:asparaginase [Nocardioides sp. TF02-7]UMG94471.1 asparaginase [Nocardioides sp. TF02-7]